MSFKNFDKEKHKMTTLTFQNTTLSVINQNNQTFLTASDLGKALDYSDADRSVRRLYTANADEFTAEMTALIEMPTAGGIQKVRIFSLRGAHLIAMFARTKVAKDFRKWVLDILDREVLQNANQIQPLGEEQQELLSLLVRSYQFLFVAHDLREKVNPTVIGIDIEKHFSGYHLYNLGHPLRQHLDKIRNYIQGNAERVMIVESMQSLLTPTITHKVVFK
jgi:possible prophage antirepressor (fragment)